MIAKASIGRAWRPRAARVSLAAREPRLRTFTLRLRDPGLSDEAWAEALASFIVAKPPRALGTWRRGPVRGGDRRLG